MKFTALSFFLFFLFVYLVHWKIGIRARIFFLTLASLLFYAAWSVPFCLHFFLVVSLNHWINKQILKDPSSVWFGVGIGLNLGNLFLFKYFYFLADFVLFVLGGKLANQAQVNSFLQSQFGLSEIILPLAISFYTFQMVAYTVDIRRGEAKENPTYLEFLLFILFFPQLVAGPIVRHGQFFEQLKGWNSKPGQIETGVALLMYGLLKKIVLADNLGAILDPMYARPESYEGVSHLLGLFGFIFQIFFDFSGYTDIARGLGKLLGIDLPENFQGPYLSRSFGEFWTRWHLTLSSWIRDYIYIPLGGSKVAEPKVYRNLIITMTLAGLWHGANFTFLLWGFAQGVFVSLERFLRQRFSPSETRTKESPPPRLGFGDVFGFLYFFLSFGLLAVFFRPNTIQESWIILGKIFTLDSGEAIKGKDQVLGLIFLGLFFNFLQIWTRWQNWIPNIQHQRIALCFLSLGLAWLLGLYAPEGADFIYFQF